MFQYITDSYDNSYDIHVQCSCNTIALSVGGRLSTNTIPIILMTTIADNNSPDRAVIIERSVVNRGGIWRKRLFSHRIPYTCHLPGYRELCESGKEISIVISTADLNILMTTDLGH